MVRIAIVEDEEKDAQELFECIQRYFEKDEMNCVIERFTEGMSFIGDNSAKFDLVFLDIEMPLLSGMETAKRLRAYDQSVCIVFVTNMPQFAINGYEVAALDFVLKPITYFNIARTIDKAMRVIRRKDEKIYVSVENGLTAIAVSEIVYIEVYGHFTTIYTENLEISTRTSLNDLEKMLVDSSIYRCSRFYMINFKYLKGIRDGEVLVGDRALKISRNKKTEILKKLAEYVSK